MLFNAVLKRDQVLELTVDFLACAAISDLLIAWGTLTDKASSSVLALLRAHARLLFTFVDI